MPVPAGAGYERFSCCWVVSAGWEGDNKSSTPFGVPSGVGFSGVVSGSPLESPGELPGVGGLDVGNGPNDVAVAAVGCAWGAGAGSGGLLAGIGLSVLDALVIGTGLGGCVPGIDVLAGPTGFGVGFGAGPETGVGIDAVIVGLIGLTVGEGGFVGKVKGLGCAGLKGGVDVFGVTGVSPGVIGLDGFGSGPGTDFDCVFGPTGPIDGALVGVGGVSGVSGFNGGRDVGVGFGGV